MTHEGGNRIRGRVLECTGGRTLIEGRNQTLADACKESNALTLEISLETDDLTQSGPARILSFSLDGMHRNFSLCQELDQLVLRLRTTKTGLNGSPPEPNVGRIPVGRRIDVMVTYRPGELRCTVDGREIKVRQVAGDFSNWDGDSQLLLGNEWKEERKWHGRIHKFAISNRFTAE